MMRHVGKLASTDSKCVVIMMQIPDRLDHALIVESDSLPDLYHQNLMSLVESQEGQANPILANLLGARNMFLEGVGNKTVMEALHLGGFLRPIPVESVVMMPTPGQAHNLKDILLQQGALPTDGEGAEVELGRDPNESTKFNPMEHNRDLQADENMIGTAKGVLLQADILAQEANVMREKAYAMAPSLRPKAKAPAKATANKAAAKKAPAKRGRPSKKAANA